MTTLSADQVMDELTANDFGPFVGVPCSILAPLITWCERNAPDRYLAANNEGEAVAIAAGTQLTGRRPVVLIQNSGLGNAVNPLTSLCHPLRIPVLLLTTWRGQPGRPDEPQHRLMGEITEPALDLMRIRHEIMSTDAATFRAQVRRAVEHLTTGLPHALVVPKGTLTGESANPAPGALPLRRTVVDAVLSGISEDTLIVATTGKTARELESGWDRPGNLYVVGSMGCASSIGLGLALGRPDRPVVVLDGDGAMLMRLEALVSIGARAPRRFVHVLLDNAAYESTGSQRTNSPSVDFLSIASAVGYRHVYETGDANAITELIGKAQNDDGPHLIRVRIAVGSDPGLGRPAISPAAAAQRLRDHLAASS